mmetsp:Transcript_21984/g.66057  ORF Transcript_21984/g.66057 Transcript_21984/m.66057 type:complete len:299 (+) Transcript_21984:116-1012(+)
MSAAASPGQSPAASRRSPFTPPSLAGSALTPTGSRASRGGSRLSPPGAQETDGRLGSGRLEVPQSRDEMVSQGSRVSATGSHASGSYASSRSAATEEEIYEHDDGEVCGTQPEPERKIPRSKSTPGPGQYAWRDSVHMRRKPSWTLAVPDRRNLDPAVGSWTPATSSCQPRAPGPVYEESPALTEKYGVPKWTYARNSGRPCLAPPPPMKTELKISLPSTFGGVSPTLVRVPQWSVFGKDRSSLPYNVPTWTPQMNSDQRPGPGQHDVIRQPNWKPRNRRGCTWGGRERLPSKYPGLG